MNISSKSAHLFRLSTEPEQTDADKKLQKLRFRYLYRVFLKCIFQKVISEKKNFFLALPIIPLDGVGAAFGLPFPLYSISLLLSIHSSF